MDVKRYFPIIQTKKSEVAGCRAMIGIRLRSILKGELLFSGRDEDLPYMSTAHPLHPETLHNARKSFLYGISAWDPDVVVELHLTSLPNLVSRPRGRFDIHLFVIILGDSTDRNNERVIERYMALTPLLSTCFPYLEFEPVCTEKEIVQSYSPFEANHAVVIERNMDTVELSMEGERPWVKGFSQLNHKEKFLPNTLIHRNPYTPTGDDGSNLINLLMLQLDPCKIIIRYRPGRLDKQMIGQMDDTIRACEIALASNHMHQIALIRQVAMIRDTLLLQNNLLRDACMDLGVFIVSPRSIDPTLSALLGRTITRGRNGSGSDVFQGGYSVRAVDNKTMDDPSYFPEDTPFSVSEAACALRFPVPPIDDQPGLSVKRFRSIMAKIPEHKSPVCGAMELFRNEHLGLTQDIVLSSDDRMRHTFIIGQTGTGKSTLMARMILQDIRRAGQGVAVIDPHGDMVDEILQRMPVERMKDVIVFDMLDRERPLGLNVLSWETEEERDLIIDSLYQTLDALYDMNATGGPIFERYFRGMLRLLMMDVHLEEFVPTLLEFSMCFINPEFRQWLKKKAIDPVIHDFVTEIEKPDKDASLANVTPYITSKFGRFITDKTLKMIIGQDKTSFDFNHVMNEGKILFIKLGKGRFGSTISALLTNQIVTRFKLAAMRRGDIPPEQRKDFYLYVDEAQNLPQENFTELLSEARKYRLGLIMSTQYTAQIGDMRNRNSLISGIMGNVGTIVSYRLGQEDANKIGRIFLPFFTARDIRELPNFNGYATTQINNQSVPPFNFVSGRDETPGNKEMAKAIIEHSRLIYGMDVKEVQSMIEKRRTVWKRL